MTDYVSKDHHNNTVSRAPLPRSPFPGKIPVLTHQIAEEMTRNFWGLSPQRTAALPSVLGGLALGIQLPWNETQARRVERKPHGQEEVPASQARPSRWPLWVKPPSPARRPQEMPHRGPTEKNQPAEPCPDCRAPELWATIKWLWSTTLWRGFVM